MNSLTFHVMTFRDAGGAEFPGEVYWAKHAPGFYQSKIARGASPVLGAAPVYAHFQMLRKGAPRRAVMANLIRLTKAAAKRHGLTLESETETAFAPREGE